MTANIRKGMAQFSYRTNIRPQRRATWNGNFTWRGFFDNLLILVAAAYLLLSTAQAWDNRRTSLVAPVILAFNGIAALFGFRIAVAKSYLLYGVFFIFSFLFLSVAPLQQIGSDFDPIFYNASLLLTSCALCAFMTAAALIFVVCRTFSVPVQRNEGFLNKSLAATSDPNYALLSLLCIAASAGVVAYLGSSLFAANREVYAAGLESSGKQANILINAVFRPLALVAPTIGFCVAFIRKNRTWLIFFALLVLLGLVVNNPLVSARFRSSTLMVFCVLTLFGPQHVRLFVMIYLAGLLASPIFGSLFRYVNAVSEERTFSRFFVSYDFSGIDIFCYAIEWANVKGFEYGSNILGALLFFVPRALWESKGKTVGEIMHDYIFVLKGFGTDNVSAPPPAEGYFSFGIAGAIVLSIAVVWVIDRIERRGFEAQVASPMYFILCLSPMLCMILLRGPFQVGVSEWAFHSATVLLSSAVLLVRSPRRGRRPRKLESAALAPE